MALKEELAQVKVTMVDGKFLDSTGSVPRGQEVVSGLLSKCFLWSDIVLERWVLTPSGMT